MYKKEAAFVLVLLVLFSVFVFALVLAQDDVDGGVGDTTGTTDDVEITTTDASISEDVVEDVGEADNTKEQLQEQVEFDVDPGITPDSLLYFVDDLVERVTIGDNPERALDYREEKIAEAKVMVNEGKPEEAVRVLDRALNYGDVLEREVSPELRQRVEESSRQVQYVLDDMRNQTSGDEWSDVRDGFDENIEKEKRIGIASDLVAKISELCEALAKLDPLQYSDTCKSGKDSPRWMKEQDKELTKEQQEQAKIFFDKLSQCFESPKECDCKGMGVQRFEDFCLEKSAIAVKCEGGDKSACQEFTSGADPTELLPDYLIPTFRKVESKYMKSEMGMHMPPECEDAGAKTPEECNRIMFSLNAPQECIDAGLTGKSREDELKCKKIMFESNAPQECINAGITAEDKDAPRKCAKIMFQSRAPQECINAGITGESRGDEKKCRQLMENQGIGGMQEGSQKYAPRFNRDCKAIQDTAEKMKCFEEFYNNAQVQVREDFRNQDGGGQKCPDGICDDFEKRNPQACPVDCGGCQSQEQVERLTQDCKNRGEDARVEDRGGCPWVICMGGSYQQPINRINQPQQPNQQVAGGGMKCPDGICDDYERMNSFACPEDCGGSRQPRNYQQQQPGDYQPPQNYQQPENRIDQPQQPPIEGYQPPQEEQPQIQQPAPTTEPAPTSEPAPESSGGEITGGIITGRIIVSDYGQEGEENSRSGDEFLDYWFAR